MGCSILANGDDLLGSEARVMAFIRIKSKAEMIRHLEKVLGKPLSKKEIQLRRKDWDKRMKPKMIAGFYQQVFCPIMNRYFAMPDIIRVIKIGSEEYKKHVLKNDIPQEMAQPVIITYEKVLRETFKLDGGQATKILEQISEYTKINEEKIKAKLKEKKK